MLARATRSSRCPYWVELPPEETGKTFDDNALDQGARRRGRVGHPGASPTTRASRSTRSTARPACTRRGMPARTPRTSRTCASCSTRCAGEDDRARRVRVRDRASSSRTARTSVFRGPLRGAACSSSPAGAAASATTRCSCPADLNGDERTMAELSQEEKDEISHRGRALRAAHRLAAAEAVTDEPGRRAGEATASRRVLNTPLIAPDAVEGLDEVRRGAAVDRLEHDPDRAEGRRRRGHGLDRDHHRGGPLEHRPARVDRRLPVAAQGRRARRRGAQYGHAKAENLAAAIEGMLILVGAGVIVYESSRRLAAGGERREHRLRHRGDRRSRRS